MLDRLERARIQALLGQAEQQPLGGVAMHREAAASVQSVGGKLFLDAADQLFAGPVLPALGGHEFRKLATQQKQAGCYGQSVGGAALEQIHQVGAMDHHDPQQASEELALHLGRGQKERACLDPVEAPDGHHARVEPVDAVEHGIALAPIDGLHDEFAGEGLAPGNPIGPGQVDKVAELVERPGELDGAHSLGVV